MRIFNSMVACVGEVERDLAEMGVKVNTKTYQDKNIEGDRDYETKEIIGYSLMLTDGHDWFDSFGALGYQDIQECRGYVQSEVSARIHGAWDRNPGSAWLQRKAVWDKFIQDDGKFSYTYPERIHDLAQMNDLFILHRRDPQSRQLVIPIYDAELDNHNRGGKKRVPCTMHFQVLHRGDYLYLIHNMRSCDLYTHFPIDLSISWLMARELANEFKAPNAWVVMQIGSLHGYRKDMEPRKIF